MLASESQVNPQVVLLSNDAALATHFNGALADGYSICVKNTPADAILYIKQNLPKVVVIDPVLLKAPVTGVIYEITGASPLSRIVIIEGKADRSVDQMALFKSGAHGFITDSISPALLVKAVESVARGEVWVPRSLISRLISDLARGKAASEARQDPAARELMAKLTPRELEVAQMVHSGGNNKMIARELDISERTVKAHLSAIFRKLNIENRLHLALFFNEIT